MNRREFVCCAMQCGCLFAIGGCATFQSKRNEVAMTENQPDDLSLAICGIDCTICPLRIADSNTQAAQSLVGWFKNEGWLKEDEGVSELMQRGPYCRGCRGDRSVHWSSSCQFLSCCIDEKQLHNCSECQDFPCEPLATFYERDPDPKTKEAYKRLQKMKAEQG